MSANKYNSLRETFTSDPILNILLSSKATPPADLNLGLGEFTQQYLYSMGQITSAAALGPVKFDIDDKPRIVGVGLFANIADGLVYIDNPDSPSDGPSFTLSLWEWNAANVEIGQIDFPQTYRCPELNQIWDVDYIFDVSGVNRTLNSLRIRADFSMVSMTFSMISVDPAYADKRLIIRPVVVIEHTFPCTEPGP